MTAYQQERLDELALEHASVEVEPADAAGAHRFRTLDADQHLVGQGTIYPDRITYRARRRASARYR